jgi:hypothetical protein
MLDTYDGLRELSYFFGAGAIICFLWLAMDSE